MMKIKKVLLLITATICAFIISSCGVFSPAPSGSGQNTGEPSRTATTSATEDNSALAVGETVQGTTDGNGRHKIDSDILELYIANISGLPKERLVYNQDGSLASVQTSNYNGEVYNFLEFDYDDSGRVREIREYDNTTGEPRLIYTFERNESGDKTLLTSQFRDSDGNYVVTAHKTIEYDEAGNRIFDYVYTADWEKKDSYYVYLYNEYGQRVEHQSRNTAADEVGLSEVYEYNENGQITDFYTYYAGVLSLHEVYIYNADRFQYIKQYDESGNDVGNDYEFRLPRSLYEIIDVYF